MAGGPWLEVVEEEAELRESQVWRAAAEEELRMGPWREEGEEEAGLLSHPWTAEAEGAEQSSGGGPAAEEEGLLHGKEVVEVLQGEQSTSTLSSSLPLQSPSTSSSPPPTESTWW